MTQRNNSSYRRFSSLAEGLGVASICSQLFPGYSHSGSSGWKRGDRFTLWSQARFVRAMQLSGAHFRPAPWFQILVNRNRKKRFRAKAAARGRRLRPSPCLPWPGLVSSAQRMTFAKRRGLPCFPAKQTVLSRVVAPAVFAWWRSNLLDAKTESAAGVSVYELAQFFVRPGLFASVDFLSNGGDIRRGDRWCVVAP